MTTVALSAALAAGIRSQASLAASLVAVLASIDLKQASLAAAQWPAVAKVALGAERAASRRSQVTACGVAMTIIEFWTVVASSNGSLAPLAVAQVALAAALPAKKHSQVSFVKEALVAAVASTSCPLSPLTAHALVAWVPRFVAVALNRRSQASKGASRGAAVPLGALWVAPASFRVATQAVMAAPGLATLRPMLGVAEAAQVVWRGEAARRSAPTALGVAAVEATLGAAIAVQALPKSAKASYCLPRVAAASGVARRQALVGSAVDTQT